MKKYIRVKEQVIEPIELDEQTGGPYIGQILKLAGLSTIAEQYDEFIHQLDKRTRQQLVAWISRTANIDYDQARIGLKRFILIWCLTIIMVADTLKYQVEILKLLTHTFCDIISPDKTKISVTELQSILQEEEIEAYECYEYFEEFSQFSENFLSVIT
ncbi:hypothetical protein [Maribellus sediminis]|uniref:hypothetical protein n=1 Tax=Maribellus sediminis TaxID=2696285 RepID=UPI0014316F0D|nr:hypothetical protein [Maribellus sediminis]